MYIVSFQWITSLIYCKNSPLGQIELTEQIIPIKVTRNNTNKMKNIFLVYFIIFVSK